MGKCNIRKLATRKAFISKWALLVIGALLVIQGALLVIWGVFSYSGGSFSYWGKISYLGALLVI